MGQEPVAQGSSGFIYDGRVLDRTGLGSIWYFFGFWLGAGPILGSAAETYFLESSGDAVDTILHRKTLRIQRWQRELILSSRFRVRK